MFEFFGYSLGENQELKEAVNNTILVDPWYPPDHLPFKTLLKYSDKQIIKQVLRESSKSYKRLIANGLFSPLHYSNNMSYTEIKTFNAVVKFIKGVPYRVGSIRSKNPQTQQEARKLVEENTINDFELFSSDFDEWDRRYQQGYEKREKMPSKQEFALVVSAGYPVGDYANDYDGNLRELEKEYPHLIPGTLSFDKTLLRDTPSYLSEVRQGNLTYDLCLNAVKGRGNRSYDHAHLECVPEEYLTKEICEIAVGNFGAELCFVPKELMTKGMCETAVADFRGARKYVPNELVSE